MSSHYIAGLDIGTASVKAVVVEARDNRLVPRLFMKEKSTGLRRGAIVDMAEITPIIARMVSEIKKFSKSASRNIYVNIGSSEIKTQNSRGIVAVSRADNEIYQDDIDRALKASQAVTLGANRTIAHTIVREYIVDGVADVADPLGLSGNRLEVNCLIIDAFSGHIKNVIKVVESAHGASGGLVAGPLAAARAALSKAQKDLGVALIDIGAQTTGLAVYEENKIVGAAKFPVGAANITNDIAIGLKIPVDAAEKLKLHYGNAMAREAAQRDIIDMSTIYTGGQGNISRRFLCQIIEARMGEIFDFVNNELKMMGRYGQLAGGVVIVGGGSKLPGVTELATQEMRLSAQIGIPTEENWDLETPNAHTYFEDPEFATTLGLALWGIDQSDIRKSTSVLNVVDWTKKVINYFLP